MNYFLVLFCFFSKNIFRYFVYEKEKCMKNYTKIRKIVENFTAPLAFFRKGGILRLYSDVDFPISIVRLDMH